MKTEVWICEIGTDQNREKIHDNHSCVLLSDISNEDAFNRTFRSMAEQMDKMLVDGLNEIYEKVKDDKAS